MTNRDHAKLRWDNNAQQLNPPFDKWPLWAVELDIEIADISGDVLEDTPEGKAKLEAYDAVREIITQMVARGPRPL